MEMLQKLGIDSTLFTQFGIFCVSYIFLTQFLFKPYMKAHHKRLEATFGHQDHAEKLNEKADQLHAQYETKTREVNAKAQRYFDQANKDAQVVQATALEKAHKESEALVHQARSEIQKETQKTRIDLKKLIPELSQDIYKKILSREL